MIHYFNPGHETAVLNASKYYQPPGMVAKMQEDLALLPVWYASPGDFVLVGNKLKNLLEFHLEGLSQKQSIVEPWGISPQSIHYFETLNKQYGLQLQIPEWKDEYRFLGSRFAAQKALAALIEAIPEIDKDILPQFYSDLEDIEKTIESARSRLLLKSPHSSSGRGLLWLPPGKLAQSEKQIISGMLKKQSQVSLEKALDKQLDFSMHFEVSREKETRFIGYSVFQTNARGAYESSSLAGQETLEKQITDLTGKYLLQKVRETLTGILHEMYSPYYMGNLGVDMLVYFSGDQFRLHPCVEINMRKSMGYLTIRLFENHLCPASQGHFFVEYHQSSQTLNKKHATLQKQYPLQTGNNRICSGYLSLCPVTEMSNYLAYILLSAF
jgi:hypothetical protein